MKLNSLVLLASLESTQDKHGLGFDCFTKVDCKTSDYMNSPDMLEKLKECAGEDDTRAQTKCGLLKFGLNNDQAEMTLNIKKYVEKCPVDVSSEDQHCTSNCFGEDKEQCLWKCVRPFKIKFQGCLGKLLNIPNYNATKSVECMNGCDGSDYPSIFDCQYQCDKNVFDALLAKGDNNANLDNKSNNSTEPSNPSEPETKTSNSAQSNKPGQSNALFSIENKTLTSIALPVLMFLLLL